MPNHSKTVRLGVVMDPIDSIKYAKDSTLAMLLEASARGWELEYLELEDLSLQDGRAFGQMRSLEVRAEANNWFSLAEPRREALAELDVILMRKDPPFDMEYIYSTYLLEAAEAEGVLVVNRPASIRNANEKLFAARFPDCMPPSLVARSAAELLNFLNEYDDIILKPLGEMGGASIFRVRKDDPNTNVIIETLTGNGAHYIMAQRFVPEISAGDKRILLVDGEPVPYGLARIPAKGETRGNLAAGGRGEGVELTERDLEICAKVGPVCRELGLMFVGIDVIGDYLTEINSTSPTCIRELDDLYNLNISAQLMDVIEKKIS